MMIIFSAGSTSLVCLSCVVTGCIVYWAHYRRNRAKTSKEKTKEEIGLQKVNSTTDTHDTSVISGTSTIPMMQPVSSQDGIHTSSGTATKKSKQNTDQTDAKEEGNSRTYNKLAVEDPDNVNNEVKKDDTELEIIHTGRSEE